MSDIVERYHESIEQGMVMHPKGLYCFYSEVEPLKALLREVIRWPFVTTELATRIRAALGDEP